MARFTVRLELNNHDDGDYELLHAEMEKESLIRVIKSHDNIIYDMPSATYNNVSNSTTQEIYDASTNAVKRVIEKKPLNNNREKKDYELLVTKSIDGRLWKLKKNTDKSKLPKNLALIN